MNHSLSKIDLDILNALQQDSGVAIKEVAFKVGLTITPTYERIKRMIRDGYIEKYIAVLDRKKLGFEVTAYCQVILKDQSREGHEEFEEVISSFPEVIEAICLYGTYDYLLKIVCSDMNIYKEFIKTKLCSVPNLAEFRSNFVSKEIKKEAGYPLELLG